MNDKRTELEKREDLEGDLRINLLTEIHQHAHRFPEFVDYLINDLEETAKTLKEE